MNAKCGAVIIGGHACGLGALRCLAPLGMPLEVVRTKDHDFAHLSRYASGHVDLLDIAQRPEGLIELLERQVERWRGWVLMPTNDHAVAAIARHHDELSSNYKLITGPQEVTSTLLEKDNLYAAAERLGIPIPRVYGYASEEMLDRDDLRFPLLVKPAESHRFYEHFGEKLFRVEDRDGLRNIVASVTESGLCTQVMDYVPGPDRCSTNYWVYMNHRGEPIGGLAGRKLRKSPTQFGVCRVGELAPDIDAAPLREATIALLRDAGFSGIASADFKLDERDEVYRLIEINIRPFLWHRVPWRAGFNMPELAYREAAGMDLPQPDIHAWPGVWVHLHEEIKNALCERRNEPFTLREYLAPYGRPKEFAVWSARDPRPFMRQWSQTGMDTLRAVGRRLRGKTNGHVSKGNVAVTP